MKTMEYTTAFKEKMVEKMLGPERMSTRRLSEETGISKTALWRWRNKAMIPGMSLKNALRDKRKRRNTVNWPLSEKYRVVLAAAAAGEEGLGELLRREGLHEADLQRFREEVSQAIAEGDSPPKRRKAGVSTEQKELRALKKELARKEKALAEAAALLVLRKKAEAFFLSEEEGDDTTDSND